MGFFSAKWLRSEQTKSDLGHVCVILDFLELYVALEFM